MPTEDPEVTALRIAADKAAEAIAPALEKLCTETRSLLTVAEDLARTARSTRKSSPGMKAVRPSMVTANGAASATGSANGNGNGNGHGNGSNVDHSDSIVEPIRDPSDLTRKFRAIAQSLVPVRAK